MKKIVKNPVAKFAPQFNKLKIEVNQKKQNKNGYLKHKRPNFGWGCFT